MTPLRSVPTDSLTTQRDRLREAKTWVVKVGSNVLVGEGEGVLDRATFVRLVSELTALASAGRRVVLVSSGAVAVGRRRLGSAPPSGTEPLAHRQALAAIGQPLLMHHYAEEFAFGGLPVAQVLLSRSDLGDRTRFLNARNTLRALLEAGVLPIVNENDTVATAELKFGDNDRLAALVAHTVEADALVILSDIDAVYDADPRANADATPLEALWADDPALASLAGPVGPGNGTGGMASKLAAARIAAERGVPTCVAAGRTEGVLSQLAAGAAAGTLLMPSDAPRSARKAWIAHGAEPAGRVVVDGGARAALVERGTSLLARGVVSVEGAFDAGASVAIVCDGDVFAHGLAGYSAEDLRTIAGARSAQIRARLGYENGDAVVHRDDLALL